MKKNPTPNSFNAVMIKYLSICTLLLFSNQVLFAQGRQITIPLPKAINGIGEEYSAMAVYGGRLYLLPQFGSEKPGKMDSLFSIYSILTDSISGIIDGKGSALSAYQTIKIKHLDQLSDSISQHYQGFEAMVILNDKVFLSMETGDRYPYCFIIKGDLDRNLGQISIDTRNIVCLKKYPAIQNGGFESLSYSPTEKKLRAIYEFNGIEGGRGYLIDTLLVKAPESFSVPHIPFRITETWAAGDGTLFGLNYYWNGDYGQYGKIETSSAHIGHFLKEVPDLESDLQQSPTYLRQGKTSYARVVKLNGQTWEQVRRVQTSGDNWEGMALFRNGALMITDANGNPSQRTMMSYVEF